MLIYKNLKELAKASAIFIIIEFFKYYNNLKI